MFELDPSLTPTTTQTFGLNCPWTPQQLFLRGHELGNQDLILGALTNLIRKRPEYLIAHVWRIFLCFNTQRREPLYAALVDLLITLNGRGASLAQRLIQGCASALDVEDMQTLLSFQQHPQHLDGNRYCLFSKGLIGSTDLFANAPNPSLPRRHDVLQIAYDFIEYSQLDEAMDTLEHGILAEPGNLELQGLLLEIYQSTRSRNRCELFQQQLLEAGVSLSEQWRNALSHLGAKSL